MTAQGEPDPRTPATENYLAEIWKAGEYGAGAATTKGLSTALGVTPSTVSAYLKRLRRSGLIAYRPYGPIELTDRGEAIAIDVIRRHRLLELFLIDHLGISWDEVHSHADLLEHGVSDRLLARIATALRHPDTDPHGYPIPDADGTVPEDRTLPASEAETGGTYAIARVVDCSPAFLRRLTGLGLGLGTRLRVLESPADALVVEILERERRDDVRLDLRTVAGIRLGPG